MFKVHVPKAPPWVPRCSRGFLHTGLSLEAQERRRPLGRGHQDHASGLFTAGESCAGMSRNHLQSQGQSPGSQCHHQAKTPPSPEDRESLGSRGRGTAEQGTLPQLPTRQIPAPSSLRPALKSRALLPSPHDLYEAATCHIATETGDGSTSKIQERGREGNVMDTTTGHMMSRMEEGRGSQREMGLGHRRSWTLSETRGPREATAWGKKELALKC